MKFTATHGPGNTRSRCANTNASKHTSANMVLSVMRWRKIKIGMELKTPTKESKLHWNGNFLTETTGETQCVTGKKAEQGHSAVHLMILLNVSCIYEVICPTKIKIVITY